MSLRPGGRPQGSGGYNAPKNAASFRGDLPVKTSAVTAADLSRSVLAVAPLARRGDLEPFSVGAHS
jgi:hypothetical protein